MTVFKKAVRRKRSPWPTVLAVVATVSWASVLFAWTRSFILSNNRSTTQERQFIRHDQMVTKAVTKEVLPPPQQIDLFPDDLAHEGFQRTLKSCLPYENPKCKTYVSQEYGKERIAVLRPPGSLGHLFQMFVQEVVRLHGNKYTNIEIVPTSHVPPYGYGKTHGYTRMIRLVTMPLVLSATDIVLDQVTHGDKSFQSIRYQDIKEALRQTVRWHCRLSAVAAHTSMMTITLEDLIDNPWEEEYKLQLFLGFTDKTHKLQDHLLEENHIEEDELEGSMEQIVDKASKLLTRIAQTEQIKLADINSVIDRELAITKNLTAWPCLSLWDVGEKESTAKITEVSKTTAKNLSPNCDDEFATCWVERDKCEAIGDAVCAKKKKR
mmetsp:Transcript_32331/g.45975  ORF Transcript_32331/g.45975 Transcript_32331/m.45975 type:complete len:379 (+) Transcript_32331:46-1182(+)